MRERRICCAVNARVTTQVVRQRPALGLAEARVGRHKVNAEAAARLGRARVPVGAVPEPPVVDAAATRADGYAYELQFARRVDETLSPRRVVEQCKAILGVEKLVGGADAPLSPAVRAGDVLSERTGGERRVGGEVSGRNVGG